MFDARNPVDGRCENWQPWWNEAV